MFSAFREKVLGAQLPTLKHSSIKRNSNKIAQALLDGKKSFRCIFLETTFNLRNVVNLSELYRLSRQRIVV